MTRQPTQADGAARAGEDLCRVVGEIHARGWCPGTSGNFSVTLEHRPLEPGAVLFLSDVPAELDAAYRSFDEVAEVLCAAGS